MTEVPRQLVSVFSPVKRGVVDVPKVPIAIIVWNSPEKKATTLLPECFAIGLISSSARPCSE